MSRAPYRWVASLAAAAALAFVVLYLYIEPLLSITGGFLVKTDPAIPSQAVVVLSTGIEYYPRLVEAARLFRNGYAGEIVINGNRKTEALRKLEAEGFKPCCPWYENTLRILAHLGVPRDRVMTISAENAYDTVSEARAVGRELIQAGIRRIILTTSAYHTRRARHIWRRAFPSRLTVITVAAATDPFDPSGWWREGRQIRWVLAEYGAWLYFFWKENFMQEGFLRPEPTLDR